MPALTATAYYNARMSIRSRARALARYVAVERGLGFRWYKRFVSEDAREHAEYLRRHGGLHAMGRDVMIVHGTEITDPAYVSIASRVSRSTASARSTSATTSSWATAQC